MPRFEPFAGVRYADEVDLDSVLAPPYDVIGPAEREELVALSPHNCVQIELPADEPGGGEDRFAVAARLWRQWQDEGVLTADPEPRFYVSRMTFTDESGAPRSTTGVVGALGLSTPGEGDVLPHERTTPKPKGERLGLQRACRANLSPVWGLSMASGLSELLAPGGTPDGVRLGHAVDGEDVTHELWALPASRVEAVAAAVGSAPVVLADGHHRYETGLAYQREVREANGNLSGPQDLIMALVVELSERELVVQAIHRLLTGLPPGVDLAAVMAGHFELTPAGSLDQVDSSFLTRMRGAGALGLLLPDGVWLARPSARTEEESEYPLDSARLGVALAELPGVELTYQHGVENITAALRQGEAEAGVLLRPAEVGTIEAMARARRLMPPKTTFFYPKPRTGMVFRSLA